jgi:phage terminase large subunit
MVSAAISVIPEVKEKIDIDGTQDYFKSTKTDIVNRMTGATIMFRGINTSSGNQTAKLKSIHGVTTFVVDEAEEWTSEEDFERIMLSIRQKGLQNRVIIIMNPSDSNHWVYKRFIEKTHKEVYYDGVPVQISTDPRVLHIHTTYLDNIEHLSPEFLNEVMEMRENEPEKYAHIMIGRWCDVAEGAVFKHVGIVDKFPENAKKVAIGVDWGYSKDYTAIVKCGIVGNRLYIEELCYKTEMLSSDIIKFLRPYADEGLFVYADSADPRLIDEVALGGIIIYGAQKGAGSILAGIDKMQTFEIFTTRKSIHLQSEFRNYIWAKDKDGRYINIPEDHDNHLIDAARYYTLAVLLGKVMKPRNIDKKDLGVF